jgi:hypothetical protein
MKEPEKYYVTKKHKDGRCDYAVTKAWFDWDKTQERKRISTKEIVRIIFWWAIKPIKWLSQWEIKKKK